MLIVHELVINSESNKHARRQNKDKECSRLTYYFYEVVFLTVDYVPVFIEPLSAYQEEVYVMNGGRRCSTAVTATHSERLGTSA